MSAFSEWFTRYMPTAGMMNDQHRFELCWNAAIKSVEVAPAASTNIPMQASIAQIAAEIERTASNFDCTNPEQYPRIMREWARQLLHG